MDDNVFPKPIESFISKDPFVGSEGRTSKKTTLHPRLLLLLNHEFDPEHLLASSAEARLQR